MQLKRRKPPKMGVRQEPQIRRAGHLRWIRGFECSVKNHECVGKIEAAHVRSGTDGGTSVKPGDNWAIPLCTAHHRTQHTVGEFRFEAHYRIDMRQIAQDLWRRSPHRQKETA